MLDPKLILANPDAVKQNCRDRNVSADILGEIDAVIELEGRRKAMLQHVEEVRRQQNTVAQAAGREKDPDKRNALMAEGKQLRDHIADNEEAFKILEKQVKERLGRVPNMTHPDAPVGQTEEANRELRRVGTPPKFDFKPKDHVEL